MALEAEFWAALARIAERRGCTITALIAGADSGREPGQPLASSLRVLALGEFSRTD